MGAEDPVTLLLGGRIDRVDFYRGEDGKTVFVRVVDYKASRHEFSAKSVTEDMNIQLLLYLFTLCSPENRALFANGDGVLPETVFPASAVYISPDETSRDGEILPCRTGVILEDTDILKAANEDLDVTYLPSVKRDRGNNLTGSGLTSRDAMLELEDILKNAILDTARDMYNGEAKRTPSKNACKFCMMKGYCSLCAD
jgi:ATP-dependent helicase/nuclease subunit B